MDTEIKNNKAYEYIRWKLLTGGIPSGQRVSDFRLAKEIGVSRSPIREALRHLESDGLVKRIPHYGTFARRFTVDELQELFELRSLLEGHAATKAARNITTAQLNDLEKLCEQMHDMAREAQNKQWLEFQRIYGEQWIATDVAFHLLIMQAAGGTLLPKIIGNFHVMASVCWFEGGCSPAYHREEVMATWRSHIGILEALRKHDPKAARQRVIQHIDAGKKESLAQFRAAAEMKQPGERSTTQKLRQMINHANGFQKPISEETVTAE